MGELRNPCCGSTVAKSVLYLCFGSLILTSLLLFVASGKTDAGRAAGCGGACTAHHPEVESALVFAEEWDKLAPKELCAALSYTGSRTQASFVSALHVIVHSDLNLWCFCLL